MAKIGDHSHQIIKTDASYLRLLDQAFNIFRLGCPRPELRGYEIMWREKRMKTPSAFSTATRAAQSPWSIVRLWRSL